MNITETTRHAIAITEQVIRSALLPRGEHNYEGRNFEVKPVSDVEQGGFQHGDFRAEYRIFEVTVKEQGDAIAVVDIVLLRSYFSREWQTAMAECHIIGWVSGSYSYRGRNNQDRWRVRKISRIAYGRDGELMEWDPYWIDTISSPR